MNTRFIFLLSGLLCTAAMLNAQVPSIQLKVKEKGFLRSERIVQIDLSNQGRQLPLTSLNVNTGQYLYFLVSPVGDWQLDADVVTENISKINIYQNEKKIPIAWKGEIISGGNNSLLLGFPKTVRPHQVFLFQCLLDEATSQAEFKIPIELWPGYSTVMDLTSRPMRQRSRNNINRRSDSTNRSWETPV